MEKLLVFIYLGYMFIAIYFLVLFLMIYWNNRKNLFEIPSVTKEYSISVLIPAYNESNTIEDTIHAVMASSYPIKEVIVLNDGSKDDTGKKAEGLKRKYKNLIVVNKENSGKADSLNRGIEMAKGDLVAVVDADSYPEKDAFRKLVGFFDDEKVALATPYIVPRNREKFLEKLQVVEYCVIAFTRKLLGFVDGIYVAPGPLALYRKVVLDEIGGFDKGNLTEDIEITWRITKAGYKREMCLDSVATTTTPDKWKMWFKQRRRWVLGGLQCIMKYKNSFLRHGMLGFFIWPFFVLQVFLGLIGLSIFAYLAVSRFISNYIYLTYSVDIGSPIITANDLMITPDFLNYLGAVLFLFGIFFTLMVLYVMKDSILKKQNIFNFAFYFIIYITVQPFILLTALYHYFRGIRKWR